jgi:hypothetical protein
VLAGNRAAGPPAEADARGEVAHCDDGSASETWRDRYGDEHFRVIATNFCFTPADTRCCF